jgi:hypothetical protein
MALTKVIGDGTGTIDNLTVADAGTIGSASKTNAITIASSGLVQLTSTGIGAGSQVFQVIDDGATLFQLRAEDGNVSFPQAGAGIYLGVTSGNSANLLNDYEEGTWSPTHTGGAGGGTLSDAKYTKIGRLVHIVFSITFNSGSGTMSIGNLPFTANSHSIGIGKEDNNNGYTVAGDLADNSTEIDLLGTQSIGSPSAYQVGTGRIRFSMTYFTD